jgi:hypothetical protein
MPLRESQRVRVAPPLSRGAMRSALSMGSAFPRAWALGAYLLGAMSLANCQSSKPKGGASVASAAPSPEAPTAGGGAEESADHGHHAAGGAGDEAAVASPSALNSQFRAQLTTLLISAHVGSVIARREGGSWVISGNDGCAVDAARMKRALDNLTTLKAVTTNEAVPDGRAFQLQISALVGEKRVVHLELADRNVSGDLARLDDDSMVRIRGLDLGLWSPHPSDWCRKP